MDVNVMLPDDDQRVLGFIPGNKVYLPSKDFQFETREVVVLRFCKDFYAKNEEKRAKHKPFYILVPTAVFYPILRVTTANRHLIHSANIEDRTLSFKL